MRQTFLSRSEGLHRCMRHVQAGGILPVPSALPQANSQRKVTRAPTRGPTWPLQLKLSAPAVSAGGARGRCEHSMQATTQEGGRWRAAAGRPGA